MSRIDHIIHRRQEGPRKIRKGQKTTLVFDNATKKVEARILPFHNQGDSWWRTRHVDLVERRTVEVPKARKGHSKVSYTTPPKRGYAEAGTAERPAMLPRPEGMSRQVHRRLYRRACKLAGVPYRGE